MGEDAFLAIILIPMGVLIMVPGLLVYNGRFRHYRKGLNTMWTGEPALASAYLGAAFIGVPLMTMVIKSDDFQMFGLIAVPAVFLAGIIGILGNFWMPRFMKPRWIKDADDEAKRQRRAAKASRNKQKYAASVTAEDVQGRTN